MPGGIAIYVAEADGEDEVMANRVHSSSLDLIDILEAANRDQLVSPIPVTIPSRLAGLDV
jgi:hypothetical protein